MARLSGLGVRRLRTLYDLGKPISFSPITVLIGRNSAGKSTFARLLPLLRQSAERKKRGPILWFDDLVDFGNLSQAVTRGESDLELVLQLDDISLASGTSRSLYLNDGVHSNNIEIDQAVVSLKLAEEPGSGATYAKEIRIDVSGTSVRICMESASEFSSLSIGTTRIELPSEKTRVRVEQGSLLPKLRFLDSRKLSDRDVWVGARNPWRNAVVEFVLTRLHGRTSRGTAAQIAAQIPISSPDGVAAAVQKISGPGSWLTLKEKITSNSVLTKILVDSLLLANIDSILERLDEVASEAVKGVRYLKPLRATAERYYRRADLAVSEIDPEGRNLAIFLDSLSTYQLAHFRDWLKSNLDIDVEPRREGAQVVLLAKTSNDAASSNVADMGFGISQVLPIAAQLWASSNPSILPFSPTSIVVVEQPELHLHPAFQATLGDLFAGVAKPIESQAGTMRRRFLPPRILIETHSQHIVNRLGLLVESGRLSPEDVTIVLFEPKQDRPGTSTVRLSNFNSEGVLQNWPFGFFEPDF